MTTFRTLALSALAMLLGTTACLLPTSASSQNQPPARVVAPGSCYNNNADPNLAVARKKLSQPIPANTITSAKTNLYARHTQLAASFKTIMGELSTEYTDCLALYSRDVSHQSHCPNDTSSDNVQYVNDCNNEAARLDREYGALQDRLRATKSALLDTWIPALGEYLRDLAAAPQETNVGFTGKKVYRMTAKSWINGRYVLGNSPLAVFARQMANDSPRNPYLNGNNDFKLYQTFTVEVQFKDGKAIHGRFIENSLDMRAGSTYVPGSRNHVGLRGAIYITNQTIKPSANGKSFTFTRTVEGRPNVLLFVPETVLPVPSHFVPVYNTLEITVTADEPEYSGWGSVFPSHTFWLGDREFKEQRQVEPAEFFGPPKAYRVAWHVCNHFSRPASVAIAYADETRHRVIATGWTQLNAGECTTFPPRLNPQYFAMALGEEWAGPYRYCVRIGSSFTSSSDSKACAAGYVYRGFWNVPYDASGTHTTNLKP
jgi:uncharacterized membrane protein